MPDTVDVRPTLDDICKMNEQIGTSPTFAEMPRLSLADKGIDGPTAAHKIEEIHTPFNFAFTTYTTGTTAFQNLVGVTLPEIEAREKATGRILQMAGLNSGDNILVTYPPVLNLFPPSALKKSGIEWRFLLRSNRDSLICAIGSLKPQAIIGESSFICATLKDAEKYGVTDILESGMTIFATGAPLDMELLDIANKYGLVVHDLYGCQEYGWIALDGVILRDDVVLMPIRANENCQMYEVLVGGLDTGDIMPISSSGHVCNKDGRLLTYRGQRSSEGVAVILNETTLKSEETARNVVKGILRIKSKIIMLSPKVITGASRTKLCVYSNTPVEHEARQELTLCGPRDTELFDSLVKAQLDYQQMQKADPTWIKNR